MFTNVRLLVKHSIRAGVFFWSLFNAATMAADASHDINPALAGWLSPAEISTMGLDSLSASQQQQLADWIEAQVAVAASVGSRITGNDSASGEQSADAPNVIKANIMGDVFSWDGNARFKLDNGQVWAQRGSQKGRARLSSPAVVIEKNFFGFYVMTLVPSGHKIRVKQVK